MYVAVQVYVIIHMPVASSSTISYRSPMLPESSPTKSYIDQAVQTEPEALLSGFVPGAGDSKSFNAELKSADMHLLPAPPTPFQLGQNSCRTSKSPYLSYSRPTESNALAKRIVSLPLTPSDAEAPTIPDGVVMRVVSLPGPPPRSPSPINAGSLGDCLGTAHNSDAHMSPGGNFSPASSKLDVPQTPSPPSSPESVLIIDSNAQLPTPFLYQQQHSRKAYIEGDGGMYVRSIAANHLT